MIKIVKLNTKSIDLVYKEALKISSNIVNKKLKDLNELFKYLENNPKKKRICFEAFNMMTSIQFIHHEFKNYLSKEIKGNLITWTYPQIRIDGKLNKNFYAPLHRDAWIINKKKKGFIIWFPITKSGASLNFSKKKKLYFHTRHKYWGIEAKDNIDLETIKIPYGKGLIFNKEQIHKSTINENRITVQLRYEVFDKQNFYKSVNQIIDVKVKNFWKNKLKLN